MHRTIRCIQIALSPERSASALYSAPDRPVVTHQTVRCQHRTFWTEGSAIIHGSPPDRLVPAPDVLACKVTEREIGDLIFILHRTVRWQRTGPSGGYARNRLRAPND